MTDPVSRSPTSPLRRPPCTLLSTLIHVPVNYQNLSVSSSHFRDSSSMLSLTRAYSLITDMPASLMPYFSALSYHSIASLCLPSIANTELFRPEHYESRPYGQEGRRILTDPVSRSPTSPLRRPPCTLLSTLIHVPVNYQNLSVSSSHFRDSSSMLSLTRAYSLITDMPASLMPYFSALSYHSIASLCLPSIANTELFR